MVEPLYRMGDTGVEGEGILCHFYESFSCCIEEISVSVDHISEKLLFRPRSIPVQLKTLIIYCKHGKIYHLKIKKK